MYVEEFNQSLCVVKIEGRQEEEDIGINKMSMQMHIRSLMMETLARTNFVSYKKY